MTPTPVARLVLSFLQGVEPSRVTDTVWYLTSDNTFGSVVVLSDRQDNPTIASILRSQAAD